MKPKVIRVYKDDDGKWRWKKITPENLKGTAASGESFDSRGNAIRAAWREAEGTDALVEVEEPE
jgi:hypothetical protein